MWRLGRLDEARAIITRLKTEWPGYTLSDEATWPTGKHPQLAEPLQTAYLNDLRLAGMEE